MGTERVMAPPTSTVSDSIAKLRSQYGCGPIEFTGTDNALYERHLVFDNVVDLAAAGPRERFEAIARSVRDILSQRWIKTENTYARENPKRVYYLSMEFLIGRSLANNVTNLLLDPLAKQAVKEKNLDWLGLLEEEPDAGLGNGGLGRLAACFLDSMVTMQLPAMGYGLRYEYGIFKQAIRDGWQQEQPDNWLRRPDPWEVARPHEQVEIKLNCSFKVSGGSLRAIVGKPSSLIGVPFDRPVVGYGGKTINTLRLWAANAPDYFDFQVFSHGDFVGAAAETLEAESLTRVLYPDDSTSIGQGPEQKARLRELSAEAVRESSLAGEPIIAKLTRAPANNAPIGGLKVVAGSGWFAARPSGTENIYKIYAESFKDQSHLNAIVSEAEEIVTNALNSSNPRRGLAEGRQ